MNAVKKETSSRRVTLSWLAPSSANTYNPLIAYIVQYRESKRKLTYATRFRAGKCELH